MAVIIVKFNISVHGGTKLMAEGRGGGVAPTPIAKSATDEGNIFLNIHAYTKSSYTLMKLLQVIS